MYAVTHIKLILILIQCVPHPVPILKRLLLQHNYGKCLWCQYGLQSLSQFLIWLLGGRLQQLPTCSIAAAHRHHFFQRWWAFVSSTRIKDFPLISVLLILPFLCCFRSDAEEEGELEPAKELIQPIAEKLVAKYKAKEEETPLLFFVAGEVRRAARGAETPFFFSPIHTKPAWTRVWLLDRSSPHCCF